jgi:ribonuclease inhibitor
MASSPANSLTIDVASVTSHDALHELLAEAFQFPSYYGRNWDAFDECIRDSSRASHISIGGLERLRARLPREAELLSQCLRSFAAEDPRRCVTFLDA